MTFPAVKSAQRCRISEFSYTCLELDKGVQDDSLIFQNLLLQSLGKSDQFEACVSYQQHL